METAIRRYDIDWLRVIAIGLLIVYHVAIPFQPWGIFIGFITSNETLDSVWIGMSMINIWRIPLLFFVSGMGVYFSMRKRNLLDLFKERTLRIFLPFVFGVFAIVPLHIYLWQYYYHQDLIYTFHQAHLWFLGNIFSYVLMVVPLFYLIKKHEEKWKNALSKIFNNPFKLILIAIPFMLASWIINPDSYPTYAMTLHGFVIGFLAFVFGFLFVFSGKVFWDTVKKWKWIYLLIAFGFYLIRVIFYEMEGPKFLMALETVIWIYAILGLAYSYLNINNKALKYLSEAVYPIYIIHWIVIHLGSIIIFGLDIPIELQFIGLVLFTLFGSLLVYHVLIRNLSVFRPLFGLKLKKTELKINQPVHISS